MKASIVNPGATKGRPRVALRIMFNETEIQAFSDGRTTETGDIRLDYEVTDGEVIMSFHPGGKLKVQRFTPSKDFPDGFNMGPSSDSTYYWAIISCGDGSIFGRQRKSFPLSFMVMRGGRVSTVDLMESISSAEIREPRDKKPRTTRKPKKST